MKHILLYCLLSFISISVQGQEVSKDLSVTKQEYLRKSKEQRVASAVLLGAGIGVIGYIKSSAKFDQFDNLIVLSVASITGSVVLFAFSEKNRRKAANMDMSLDLQRFDHTTPQGNEVFPAVSIKMMF